jgi:membrane associated rhomboid family serine protease
LIPIRDTIRSSRRPVMVYLIIAANVAAFFWEIDIERSRGAHALVAWIYRWALVPSELVSSGGAREYATIFTAMFLHGGLLHLGGNMLYLYIFGDNVEDRMGRLPFLVFYLLCGLAAAGAQIAIEPRLEVPMLGASGAVAGVLGAYLVLFPRARVVTLVPIFYLAYFVELPAVVFLAIWIIFQNLIPAGVGLAPAAKGAVGGIAYWAHIGGFFFGAGVALVFRDYLRGGRPIVWEPPAPRWRG